MQHVQSIIQAHGGLGAVDRNYLRIENDPFMPLVIEVVSPFYQGGACEVSVAHYGVMNGDAMRDPEVTFFVTPAASGPWVWTPLSFTNNYVGIYQRCAEYDEHGRIQVLHRSLTKQLSAFSTAWDINIKEQGFVEAYRRMNPAATIPAIL